MTNTTKLRPAQVVAFVQMWLNRKGYTNDFRNDVSLLLAENRRARHSNIVKYDEIPFSRSTDGKIYYDFEDIKRFIKDRLEPICKELERKRLEKAAKGARLPYAA
jgi:hypothetical protein